MKFENKTEKISRGKGTPFHPAMLSPPTLPVSGSPIQQLKQKPGARLIYLLN
jgi:hypothetical protein